MPSRSYGGVGRIIVTIAGPWSKPPALESPLDLAFGPPSAEFVEEFADLGRRAGVVTDDDLRRLRKHQGLVRGTAEVARPGDLEPARRAARLAVKAFAQGALGVYVETAPKVFAPGALDGLDVNDPAVLLHMFTEVLGDEEEIIAEGLQAFGLPDVAVRYAGEVEIDAAQAAAFAFAARMVLDRWTPSIGIAFRASESAPVFKVAYEEGPAVVEPDDVETNPRGAWVLTRVAG